MVLYKKELLESHCFLWVGSDNIFKVKCQRIKWVNSVRFSWQFALILMFSCVAITLSIAGELSGEFGKIRQLTAKPPSVFNITRGEFISLNNGVSFSFDVDGENNDILRVKLFSNQTFSWHETIHEGSRIFRSETFTLDMMNCSFEVDVSIKSYDRQILQIIDNTKVQPRN